MTKPDPSEINDADAWIALSMSASEPIDAEQPETADPANSGAVGRGCAQALDGRFATDEEIGEIYRCAGL